ncbi:MAG: oligosaccharide flippase family protein [Burkholderiales bacterium]|nr:oligosaccharide flippase family protein [Burkholderiales bacterium]
MTSIRKAVLISFAENYSTMFIGFIGIMLIARLLTPEEIGIYSVASAVTGIAHMMRDFGVGSYLVQEQELTRERIQTALTVAIMTSWAAGGILYLSSPWAAVFYNEPGLMDLIRIQCVNFLIMPFTAPVLSLLHRDMQFSVLYRINVLLGYSDDCFCESCSVGIWLYESCLGSVANVMCLMLLVNAVRPHDAWIMPGLKEWRRIANFGVQTSVAAIVTEIAMNMNDLILGRLLGFQAVALYSRAQGLIYLFHRDMMNAVRKVAFPAFAQAVRENRDLLKAYLLSVNYITVFAWPFYAFLGLYADSIVRLMFGDQWDASIPLVRILVFAGAVGAFWNLWSSALLAMGHVNKTMRSELIIQPIRIVLIFFAASISMEMTCYALIIIYILQLLISTHYLKQSIGLNLKILLLNNINSFAVTLISMVIPVLCYTYLSTQFSPIQSLLIGAITCIPSWLLGIFIVRHPICVELTRLLGNRPELQSCNSNTREKL